MAEESEPASRLERLAFPIGKSLTARILAVNLIPLLVLAGSLFFLDSYRRQLLDERFKLARIEAQITAEALAGATVERQEALLSQIGREQGMRLRMYDATGALTADSFELDEPSFVLADPEQEPFWEEVADFFDQTANILVGAPSPPPYAEPEDPAADNWPELARVRQVGLTQIELRRAADGTPVINAAAPLGNNGASLLTTRAASDITQAVRSARTSLMTIILLALLVSTVLSLYLANTIIQPLRRLVLATQRVRQGRSREVEVPRMDERGDEIGLLARAVSDMTATLRHRIDAVEAFAADVAHEIKNPLASLRSATESLPKVEDPDLRAQLVDVAAHDVRRIDRLVTEISEASRIDAELSRATFETVDLAELFANVVARKQNRDEVRDCVIEVESAGGHALVNGVPIRLERVAENLLDNAVSFSPEGGRILVRITDDGTTVQARVGDEGPGIPEDAREKVFSRFHSHRPEGEEYGNHSGLGLAIGRTIAEAHDGSLSVADGPTELGGAELVLELPAA